jgi:4-amino-4-deoxy-L-arabinose transferase-like glycosyltransferase
MTATVAADPPAARPRWAFIALGAILLGALAIRLWNIDQNGYGTEYYSAGVRSMLASWHNFFFNSFDPAGFVSLDKPPLAFWIQAASAKLFGFGSLSILLPQVLEGVLAIVLLYHLVQRHFGVAAGLIAAIVLAVSPISVAVDRSSNTESLLVLVLLLAGWALVCATERGSLRLLVLAMGLVGVAFNVKMAVAFVVAPTLALVYLVGAPVAPKSRLVHLVVAGLGLAAVSISWATAYDLAAPDNRPFAGGTRGNSMIELAVWGNGLNRFLPSEARVRRNAAAAPDASQPPQGRRFSDNVPAGLLRLADRHLAGQFAWLLPLAVIGFIVALLRTPPRWPLDPPRLTLVLWAGWALSYGAVFSFDSGSFHAYYLAMLAPPLAALTGIGLVALWSRYWDGEGPAALLLPLALALTAAWQGYLEYGYLGATADFRTWLFAALVVGTIASVAGLVLARRSLPRLAPVALAAGLVALLVTPVAWALSTVLARGNVALPSASIATLAGADERPRRRIAADFGTATDDQRLLAFLTANRANARFLLATPNARLAAPIIIRTGEPVMAMGGFSGADRILTREALARMVADGGVRFVMIATPDPSRATGFRQARGAVFAEWVQAAGKAVDPALWRSQPASADAGPRPRRRNDQMQLYDLKPEIGLNPA